MLLSLAQLSEPLSSAVLLLIFGALCALSVLFSRFFERLGVPVVLLFMLLGMLGGSEGIGGLTFDNYAFAARVGTIALVLILFDGGLNTSASSFREVIWPSSILATAGVAITAIVLAIGARFVGLAWGQAMLLGAIVSSTDAAAVFAVLRGGRLQLKRRVGRTLEVESCINDPMAVILTLAVTDYLLAQDTPSWISIAIDVPLQLAIGTLVGAAIGLLGRRLLTTNRVTTVGLIPALTVSLAFLSFGAATLMYGSGFASVFITALVLGNAQLGYRSGLARVHDALAWMSQVAMFLMLGLLVFPSQLKPAIWTGLALALILAFIARPLAVAPLLIPFKYPKKEIFFLSWVGLRGAVPIVLATYPVLAGVPGSRDVFNLVFFIVVLSTIIPGATVRWITRWLKLGDTFNPTPSAVLEINAPQPLEGNIESFPVTEVVAVCNAKLAEIDFPEGASVILVVRGREVMAAKGNTILQPGDHAYVFFRPQDRSYIELLFGAPEAA